MPTAERIMFELFTRGRRRRLKPMPIKNVESSKVDELRPEYDLTALKGGVRGKYHARATAGTILVLLEPDIAEAFSDGASVNQALRTYLQTSRGKPPKKASQSTSTRKKSKSKQRSRAARS
jgi:hypothetical protein